VSDTGDRVTVEVEMPAAGWLILTDNYYPGWHAQVNNKSAEIRRANLFARAVRVPAGKSRVVFTYKPASFWIGAVISAIAIALVGAGFVWSRRSNRPVSMIGAPVAAT
jgi:uncharacterized membrane protein YfhO